jgi:hypothetical protein
MSSAATGMSCATVAATRAGRPAGSVPTIHEHAVRPESFAGIGTRFA